MPRRWCWWRRRGLSGPRPRRPEDSHPGGHEARPYAAARPDAETGSGALLAAVLLLLLPGIPAGAATVLEKTVRHTVEAGGAVTERVTLRVLLESEQELASWSPYPVYLDDNRTLQEIRTWAELPGGERVVVKAKEHDTAEVAFAGELHSSRRLRLVEFPPLPAGSELVIATTVREEPYFPGGVVALGSEAPIAALTVEIEGAPGLVWKIDGDTQAWGGDALKTEGGENRLRLVGEGLPAVEPPDFAPAGAAAGAVLYYTWGGEVTWPGVAAWYQGLLDQLPALSPEVAAQARALTAGVEEPRRRIEALLAHARQKVRYVAVQLGIGGFRPSPPPQVLERGWGDCKDKSTLLVEMLRHSGIEAYPVLVLSGRDRRIDPELPTPYQFNHAIVAVPAEGLEVGEDDPVSGGYLFLDPTHEKGTSRWLHPAVQAQHALVVRGAASELVETPRLFRHDRRELAVDLDLATPGGARGNVELALTGRFGSVFEELLESEPVDRLEELVRSVLGRVLPGSELSGIGWDQDLSGGVPRVVLRAAVRAPGLVQGSAERRSLRLAGLGGVPPPSLLEERTLPVVLSPGVATESWRLRLAPGLCPSPADDAEAVNPLGSFRHGVSGGAGEMRVERRLELNRRWVEPEDFAALAELGLAETRATKRRVRFGACP